MVSEKEATYLRELDGKEDELKLTAAKNFELETALAEISEKLITREKMNEEFLAIKSILSEHIGEDSIVTGIKRLVRAEEVPKLIFAPIGTVQLESPPLSAE
jgi:hypothetical protein